jgi:SAM-dependent methyltransferase
MYSEEADFLEKEAIYSDMALRISRFAGRDWMELVKGRLALEIGGSGGLLAGIFSSIVDRVICTDIIDLQLKYDGQFPRLLKEKFERNSRSLNLGKIEFQVADAQNLFFRDGLFDLVFTQNALEHIPDPLTAIREAFRVLKPGGIFYATFDPVWTADSGSHFLEFVNEPWLQILLTDDEFCECMRNGGADDWQIASYRGDMNRLPSYFYRQQIPLVLSAYAQKFEFENWRGCTDKSFTHHENRTKAAIKLNCDPDDLLIRGFRILAVKPVRQLFK